MAMDTPVDTSKKDDTSVQQIAGTIGPRVPLYVQARGDAVIRVQASATFTAVSSVAPVFLQTAIVSAEPALERLPESVLYTCARDELPVGPRIGIQDVPEPTLKALANYELERRGRNPVLRMPAAVPPSSPSPIPPSGGGDHHRWYADLLVKMVLEYAAQAVKFLTLANAGGSVALLSFMGASPEIRAWDGGWRSLGLFVAGIVLAGLLAGVNFASAVYLAFRFRNRTEAFAKGQIPWAEIFQAPRWYTRSIIVPILLGLLSFVCFIWGAWQGIAGYRNLVTAQTW